MRKKTATYLSPVRVGNNFHDTRCGRKKQNVHDNGCEKKKRMAGAKGIICTEQFTCNVTSGKLLCIEESAERKSMVHTPILHTNTTQGRCQWGKCSGIAMSKAKGLRR